MDLLSQVEQAFLLFSILCLSPTLTLSQQLANVPEAFRSLSSTPQVIRIKNRLTVPRKAGHLQGIQLVEIQGREKLVLSGSSANTAYLLQADLLSKQTDQYIPLMDTPFRHAGGIQAHDSLLVVGIEDNILKTSAKVCIYLKDQLQAAQPIVSLDREGEAKRVTAGATGLLALDESYLLVVGNWDSRNWDVYLLLDGIEEVQLFESISAPDDWGNYQSINLLKDSQAIYAIGTYQEEGKCMADLILLQTSGNQESTPKKILSKQFYCKKGVDFGTAAGIQIDQQGKLHIWASQRDAKKKIYINTFSQK